MKYQSLVVLIISLLSVSACAEKTKGRIEKRVSAFIEDNISSSQSIHIDYILALDSLDVVELAQGTIEQTERIDTLFMDVNNRFLHLDEQLTNSQRMKIRNRVRPIWEYWLSYRENALIAMSEATQLKQALNLGDINQRTQRIYEIRLRLGESENPLTLYACDCALIDSVIIGKERISIEAYPEPCKSILDLGIKLSSFNDERMGVIKELNELIGVMEGFVKE
jgi:hypothetical protein